MDDAGILVNQPFVVDSGSSSVKCGIAGESEPSLVFASYVGRPKHERSMVGSLEGSTFIGASAQEHRGLMALKYPISHGIVTDWADMEQVWQHMYTPGTRAAVNSEEHPVLITEPPHNPKRNRETMSQIFFETFNVPAIYFAIPAVLALYSAGKTTGLVLDVGDGVAHAVPVYQGFSLSSAVTRSDLAGTDVTDFLQLLLRKQGIKLTTSTEREIVKEIKDAHSFLKPQLPPTRGSTLPSASQDSDAEQIIMYKLPDGQKIRLSKLEMSRAPEALFRPHIVGLEDKPVAQLLSDAVAKADIDLRAPLYQNIVLSGGTTQTRGFGDRLLNEMKLVAPQSTKIRIFAPPNRSQTVWIGGSILAGLSTFRKLWLSADEWAENPERVHSANN